MDDLDLLVQVYHRYNGKLSKLPKWWNFGELVERYPFLIEEGIVEELEDEFCSFGIPYGIADWDKLAYLVETLEM